MELIRKQVMLSKWINDKLEKVSNNHVISQSEVVRIALMRLFYDEGALERTLKIVDYEHKKRKMLE